MCIIPYTFQLTILTFLTFLISIIVHNLTYLARHLTLPTFATLFIFEKLSIIPYILPDTWQLTILTFLTFFISITVHNSHILPDIWHYRQYRHLQLCLFLKNWASFHLSCLIPDNWQYWHFRLFISIIVHNFTYFAWHLTLLTILTFATLFIFEKLSIYLADTWQLTILTFLTFFISLVVHNFIYLAWHLTLPTLPTFVNLFIFGMVHHSHIPDTWQYWHYRHMLLCLFFVTWLIISVLTWGLYSLFLGCMSKSQMSVMSVMSIMSSDKENWIYIIRYMLIFQMSIMSQMSVMSEMSGDTIFDYLTF